MPTLADRLREALADGAGRGLSQKGLADACGIKEPSVSGWLSGASKNLKNDNLIQAADYLGVNVRWLAIGEKPKAAASDEGSPVTEDTHLFVNKVKGILLSAGPGHVSWEHEEIDKSHAFTKSWMREKGINPKRARIIPVAGNSMAPYVRDGDVVLVNLEKNKLRSGEVFAIAVGDETRIKRLVRRSDGAVEVRSDNASPEFSTEILRGQEIDMLNIIGMVEWRGG